MLYDAAIFDLDDTLLNSVEMKWAHHKACAMRHYGVEVTDEDLREHWGKPLDVMIGELYRHADTVENMLANNRAMELEFPKSVIDGALETITQLSAAGLPLGIVTSGMHSWVMGDFQRLSFPHEAFLFVHGMEECTHHKPDGRVFNSAREVLSAAGHGDRIVYVGDALIDHAAAVDAGFDFIGVTTGLVTAEEFTAIGARSVSRVADVVPLILGTQFAVS